MSEVFKCTLSWKHTRVRLRSRLRPRLRLSLGFETH